MNRDSPGPTAPIDESLDFGIRPQVLAVLLFTISITVVMSGAIFYFFSQQGVRETAIEHLRTAAEIQAQRTEALRDALILQHKLIADRTQLRLSPGTLGQEERRPATIKRIQRSLRDATAISNDLIGIYIFSPTGTLVASRPTEPALNPSTRTRLQDLLRTATPSNEPELITTAGDETQILIASALWIGDKHVGTFVTQPSAVVLVQIAASHTGLGETGETVIAVRNDDEHLVPLMPLRFTADRTSPLKIRPHARDDALTLHYFVDYRGEAVFAVERAIKNSDWIVFVKRDETEVFAQTGTLRRLLIFSLAASLLLALVVAYLFSSTLTRPILHISDVSQRIADGDFKRRVVISSKDEIGLLARSINVMADRLIRSKEELEKRVQERTEELEALNQKLNVLNKKWHTQSRIDELTGIPNRRVFNEQLDIEWRRCQRNNTPISLLLADIDLFKLFNDRAGHRAGDACLHKVARCLQKNIRRAGEIVARYGGEEFVVLLPGTDVEAATALAEKLRRKIVKKNIMHPDPQVKRLTMSFGVASCVPDRHVPANSLFINADKALYEAKSNGRNQVCTHRDAA